MNICYKLKPDMVVFWRFNQIYIWVLKIDCNTICKKKKEIKITHTHTQKKKSDKVLKILKNFDDLSGIFLKHGASLLTTSITQL